MNKKYTLVWLTVLLVVTEFEAAEMLSEEEPISAIRVKVAGVSMQGFNPA